MVKNDVNRNFNLPEAPNFSKYLRKGSAGVLSKRPHLYISGVDGVELIYKGHAVGGYIQIRDRKTGELQELSFGGQDPVSGKYVHLTYEKKDTRFTRTDEFKDIPFP